MSFCVVFMVLLVTSKLAIGQTNSNVVPSNNVSIDGDRGDQQQQMEQHEKLQQVTPEANTVATSTEVQGAQTRNEKKFSNHSSRKYDGPTASPTTVTASTSPTSVKTLKSTTAASAKEPIASHSPGSKNEQQSENLESNERSSRRRASKSEESSESHDKPERTSRRRGSTSSPKTDPLAAPQVTTPSTPTTTYRMVRNSSAPPGRDNKLMSLLAARRTALQRDRWRTHRRGNTTSKAAIETTSKAPSDPRTQCERNCTKNFTRRTTASCMRRCATLHKSHTTSTPTTPSTTPSMNSTSQRTKVDEKDNNEILETDESSHGFFVVTKDLNDTVNHIGEEIKMSQAEKGNRVRKIRPPTVSPVSVEESDMAPYVYFGQKLPSNKPTVLRISKVSDDHPKVLEVSAPKQTDRNLMRQNYYKRRNLVAHNRRQGASAFTKTALSTSTTKEELASPKDISVNDSAMVDNTTLTILPRSTVNETANSVVPVEELTTPLTIVTTPSSTTTTTETTLTPELTEPTSTPLLINVPDMEETKDPVTEPIIVPQLIPRVAELPPGFPHPPIQVEEEKKNLIVFLNVTTPKPTTTTTPSTTTSTTAQTTTTSTEPSTTTSTTTTVRTTPSRSPSTTTTTTTTASTTVSTTFPPSSTTFPPSSTTPRTTTSLVTTLRSETVDPSTTTKIFTKTTVSSSIRSTVNPRTNPSTSSTPPTLINVAYDDFDSFEQTVNETSNIFLNFTSIFRGPSIIAAKNPDSGLDGSAMNTSEVTIEEHRINLATYVLAGFGMLPILGIILYIVKTVIFKRLTKDEAVFEQYVPDGQPISPVHKIDKSDDGQDLYSVMSDQEFDRSNLRFKSLLGEGNFGQVWKAEADDLSGHLGTTRIVAVKTIRSGSSQCGLKDEADIMRKLGSHPNVVTLLGTCLETEPHLLIMEYAMRGRLLSLLRAARSATNILPASVPGGRSLAPLSPRTLAGFCLDIARGMEYIADRKIVHRDLAARNVLLDHNGVCKICDFGMSIDLEADRKKHCHTRKVDFIRHHTNVLENRFKFDFGGRLLHHWNDHHVKSNNNREMSIHNNNNNNNHEKKHHDSVGRRPALPIRWMAPEALQYHVFTSETDVWAFGIVLWEIATLGCTPYPNLSGREVVRNVPNGVRPELPPEARPEFYDLMTRCWRKDPRQRPTFREARIEISRSICTWVDDDQANSDYMDVSGFSEDLEHGMVYFNRRISEFECEI